jgi:hypothetical protein
VIHPSGRKFLVEDLDGTTKSYTTLSGLRRWAFVFVGH